MNVRATIRTDASRMICCTIPVGVVMSHGRHVRSHVRLAAERQLAELHHLLIRAKQLVEECDGLLVVGSSLMVYSAFRLARAAATSGAQLALLSVGPTRADDIADIKVKDMTSAMPHVGGGLLLTPCRVLEVSTANCACSDKPLGV